MIEILLQVVADEMTMLAGEHGGIMPAGTFLAEASLGVLVFLRMGVFLTLEVLKKLGEVIMMVPALPTVVGRESKQMSTGFTRGAGSESLIIVSLMGEPQPSGKRAGGQRRRVDGHEGPRSLLTHTTVKRDLFYEGRSRDGGRSRVAAGGRQMTNKVERF